MQKGYCKHTNGSFHNTHCACGVEYLSVTPRPEDDMGRVLRLPCRSIEARSNSDLKRLDAYGPIGTCDKYEEPSEKEIEESEKAMDDAMEQMAKTFPLIAKVKSEHKGEGWSGREECPVCKGVLNMSHAASNGHVWGQCETKDCLSWME